MKYMSTCLWIVSIAVTFNAVSHAQELMLLRGATVLPQTRSLLWESVFYHEFEYKYDFAEKKYTAFEDNNTNLFFGTMLGIGILDNLELLTHLPLLYRSTTGTNGGTQAKGIGDISLQSRLMLYPGSEYLPAWNVGAMVRLPTGIDSISLPLGDGSTDYGFSTVATQKFGLFILHVKLGYIFNGPNKDKTDLGDQFMYMVKGDFVVLKRDFLLLKKLTLMLGLAGKFKFTDRTADGTKIENSEQYRSLNIVPMVRWTVADNFFIRPRVTIPIRPWSEGGKLYPVQYTLDISLEI